MANEAKTMDGITKAILENCDAQAESLDAQMTELKGKDAPAADDMAQLEKVTEELITCLIVGLTAVSRVWQRREAPYVP